MTLEVINYFTSAYSGYSNRIRGLLTVERAKQEFGFDYAVNWTRTHLISCDLDHILKNKIKKTDQFEHMMSHRLLLAPKDDLTGYGPRMSKPEQRFIDCEYERIPQNIRDAYLPYFRWLEFQPYITDKVEKIVESFKGETPLGVHYRNAGDWSAIGRQCPPHIYEEAINTFPKDTPIYLIVHGEELAKHFANFGSRIIMQPDKCYDIKDIKHTQDVAVESLVLSRLNNMVADHLSTFAETSWWLGGCKAKVVRVNVREICK